MPPVPGLLHLGEPAPIRLRAFYRSAGALLRELSRALNRGRTTLRAESGLSVGTRLALVMAAEALAEPIEVSGTITDCRRRGPRYEIGLRYDFDSGRHGARLAEAVAVLERETLRPRREPRIPLALRAAARGLEAVVREASPGGCQIELGGARLPDLEPGSRLVLELAPSRPGAGAAVRVGFEVRWAGPAAGPGRRRRRLVGGRFVGPSPAARRRLRSILRFEDVRPRIRIRRVVPAKPGRRRDAAGRNTAARGRPR